MHHRIFSYSHFTESFLCWIIRPSHHLLVSEGDTRRISKAIGHMRDHFDEPLKNETIARQLGMSVFGFHHHFKSVPAISPLQFQKQLRLQEVRRLIMKVHLDAATAGFRVGYEDPTYFNRDYKSFSVLCHCVTSLNCAATLMLKQL